MTNHHGHAFHGGYGFHRRHGYGYGYTQPTQYVYLPSAPRYDETSSLVVLGVIVAAIIGGIVGIAYLSKNRRK